MPNDGLPDVALPDAQRVPLMSGLRLDMYRALHCDSYYQLLLLMNKHSALLDSNAADLRFIRSSSAKIQQDHRNKRALAAQLLCLPPDLLMSIVMGTLAYDVLNPSGTHPFTYKLEGMGTYIFSVAIEGRNGHFLTTLEIEALIRALEKYCRCYLRQNAHGGNPTSPQDNALAMWAHRIDTTYGSRPGNAPNKLRFILNDDALKRVRSFIQGLQSRCDAIANSGKSRSVWLTQAPLGVGCSKNLPSRVPQHNPNDASGLRHSTYTWGLTLCLLRGELYLAPKSVVLPVLQVWDNSQLAQSEVLVSALASSYCFQDGFNVCGAGSQNGTLSDPELLRIKQYMLYTQPYFEQNSDAMFKELDKRKQYIDNVRIIANFLKPDEENKHKALMDLHQEAKLVAARVQRFLTFAQECEEQAKAIRVNLSKGSHMASLATQLLHAITDPRTVDDILTQAERKPSTSDTTD